MRDRAMVVRAVGQVAPVWMAGVGIVGGRLLGMGQMLDAVFVSERLFAQMQAGEEHADQQQEREAAVHGRER